MFFFSSRRRHTRCALVTGVQTCALPISSVIAAVTQAAGFKLQPYAMSPDDVPTTMRVKTSARTLERIHHFACAAGWPELGQSVLEAGFVAEQEALERG